MNGDDRFVEAGKRLKALFAKYSPIEKQAMWKRKHGQQLVNTVKHRNKHHSLLEALLFAEGLLTLEEGVYNVDDNKVDELVEMSRVRADAFDLLKNVCATRLAANVDLSMALQVVAAGMLSGELKRPKKGGRPRSNTWARDVLICRGVEAALKLYMQKERSKDSNTPCAFSVVADTFVEAGEHLVNYDTVRNVWRKRVKSGLMEELKRLELTAATLQLQDQSFPSYSTNQ